MLVINYGGVMDYEPWGWVTAATISHNYNCLETCQLLDKEWSEFLRL